MAVAMEHRPRYVFATMDKTYSPSERGSTASKSAWKALCRLIPSSAPLHVLAITRDDGGRNFGRLLNLKDTLGRWKEWAMPMSILAGDGIELRRCCWIWGGT